MNIQKQKAKIFQNMHKEKMFVIPNVWDVGSAYVFEKQGFLAVATSSAGIAYDLGYPDGEDISFDDLVWVVEKIANRIDIPVSVDFERGYGETGTVVKDNARKLLIAGAVGFNIEDGLPNGTLSSLKLQIEKIKALCELKKELDIDFVINARTCAYWINVADNETKFQIACERCNAFAQAGADSVFIPGGINEITAKNLVKNINAPVNLILNSSLHDFNKLNEIGVRRISVGSAPVRYVYDKTISMARKLYDGDTNELLSNDFNYSKANEYFTKNNDK